MCVCVSLLLQPLTPNSIMKVKDQKGSFSFRQTILCYLNSKPHRLAHLKKQNKRFCTMPVGEVIMS